MDGVDDVATYSWAEASAMGTPEPSSCAQWTPSGIQTHHQRRTLIDLTRPIVRIHEGPEPVTSGRRLYITRKTVNRCLQCSEFGGIGWVDCNTTWDNPFYRNYVVHEWARPWTDGAPTAQVMYRQLAMGTRHLVIGWRNPPDIEIRSGLGTWDMARWL